MILQLKIESSVLVLRNSGVRIRCAKAPGLSSLPPDRPGGGFHMRGPLIDGHPVPFPLRKCPTKALSTTVPQRFMQSVSGLCRECRVLRRTSPMSEATEEARFAELLRVHGPGLGRVAASYARSAEYIPRRASTS